MTITLALVMGRDPAEGIDVQLTIDDRWYDLGTYDTVLAAAERMGRWVRGRGLVWAPGSQRRVDDAHRLQSPVLVLEAVTPAEYDQLTLPARQAWHHVDAYPYAHTARSMGL
jgi:hypothetical protein